MGGAPRHRAILNLGKLEELPNKNDYKLLADRIEQLVYRKETIFEITHSQVINRMAEHFSAIIINKNLVDAPDKKKSYREKTLLSLPSEDFQNVDINSIGHTHVREVGAEWLCKQTLDRLDLAGCLKQLEWDERWINIAMIYLIGRAVFPASDLKTEDWLVRNTALAELYNMEPDKISRHHFYKVSRMLYGDREKIEFYLSYRTGKLFDVEDKIVLYDLTNTYFEGQKKESQKARFGKSKEKRNDAKLMALALVVNAAGFIKYSKIYEGNIKDSETLQRTIEDMQVRSVTNVAKKVVVMDAGISTEDNLKMLREQGYEYVCVALGKMKDYRVLEPEKETVKLTDEKGNTISMQWVEVEGKQDNILYVKSDRKQLKEAGMEDVFCKRYEEGLVAIKKGIEKKSGVKTAGKVYERLGRLKEKYPSVHRYYQIKIFTRKGTVTKMAWEKTANGKNRQGVYFVRTTLKSKDEKTLWNIYNTIREIEATFRVLKTDLKMRPVFHQEDIYSESHIYGSILAYTVVHSIRYPVKSKRIHLDWGNIVRRMNTQKVITTTMNTKTGNTIRLKKCSDPEAEVREIYQALGYKDRPFWEKKSVLPKTGKEKYKPLDTG